jgi:hypothetical protein
MKDERAERWAYMITQYLLSIDDYSPLSRDEMLSKLKVKLGSDDGITCITIGITDDYAFEANLFKNDGDENIPINCDFGDLSIINKVIKDSQSN